MDYEENVLLNAYKNHVDSAIMSALNASKKTVSENENKSMFDVLEGLYESINELYFNSCTYLISVQQKYLDSVKQGGNISNADVDAVAYETRCLKNMRSDLYSALCTFTLVEKVKDSECSSKPILVIVDNDSFLKKDYDVSSLEGVVYVATNPSRFVKDKDILDYVDNLIIIKENKSSRPFTKF